MHITINSLFGAASLASPAKRPSPTPQPGNKFAGQPGDKTAKKSSNSLPIGIDQVGEQAMKPQMPQHELNIDHPTNMHDPEDAQNQFNFLKQAMGGPQEGFVTTTSKSHAIAHKLAKSGHLSLIQEAKLGNGHTKKHWQLTQKGVAAVGQTQNKAGRR